MDSCLEPKNFDLEFPVVNSSTSGSRVGARGDSCKVNSHDNNGSGYQIIEYQPRDHLLLQYGISIPNMNFTTYLEVFQKLSTSRSLEDSGKKNKKTEIKFIGSEFDNVFEKIYQKQNIEEYYSVRYLSKIHQSRFENQFYSTFINYEDLPSHTQSEFFDSINNLKLNVIYENLRSFVESEFSSRVKYLNVMVEVWGIHCHLNDNLRYISTKYLPNIQQVNVIFTNNEIPQPAPIDHFVYISVYESLIFRGVNFVSRCKRNFYFKKLQLILCCDKTSISRNYEILNCNFDSVNLALWDANKVTIFNSSFKNVDYWFALEILGAKSQVIIQNIQILNCTDGMRMWHCNNPIIDNLKIKNISEIGCKFQYVNGVRLSNALIVGGKTGINLIKCKNAKILDCTIKDYTRYGIQAFGYPIVKFKGIHLGKDQEIYYNIDNFVKAEDKHSVSSEIL